MLPINANVQFVKNKVIFILRIREAYILKTEYSYKSLWNYGVRFRLDEWLAIDNGIDLLAGYDSFSNFFD
jgi:hypothetical protein